MKLSFLFSFFICATSYSQQITPFDFLAASRAANKISKFNGVVGTGLKDANACHTLQAENGTSVVTCAIEPSDYTDSVITKVEFKSGKIPLELQKNLPPEFIREAQNKNVSCVIRLKMINDNRGALGCKDRSTGITNNDKNAECGDDFGLTHGMSVGVGCQTADGISNTYSYSTDLYSNPNLKSEKIDHDGTTHLNQKFTSENIFSWMQDNINQGNATYWKRGVGFINLSEKKKWGFGQSTGQQEWFHYMINRVAVGQAYDYTYEEGSKDRWGAFVALNVGLQENRTFGDRCKLSMSVDVGGRLATVKDSNTLNLNADAKFSAQLSENGAVYLRAQSETVVRPGSTVSNHTIAAGYERTSGTQIEMGITKQNGNRKDVWDKPNIYSKVNDLIVSLKVSYGF